MQETIKKLILLYTKYIEELKHLSARERDEVSRILSKHKDNKEKKHGRFI